MHEPVNAGEIIVDEFVHEWLGIDKVRECLSPGEEICIHEIALSTRYGVRESNAKYARAMTEYLQTL